MPALPTKKRFGQHFLRDKNIASRICDSLKGMGPVYHKLLEVGPGEGVLTGILLEKYGDGFYVVEIDRDLIPGLVKKFSSLNGRLINQDFLELNLDEIFKEPFGIIGNFPYNISSQIVFKLVEHRDNAMEMVGMFQREVAQRIAAKAGTKTYGLLSAWVQIFYDAEYLFTVQEGSFVPPPKVKSGVVRLTRKQENLMGVDADFVLEVIKAGFGQRRKTLRNALRSYQKEFPSIDPTTLDKRAEVLSPEDFVKLASQLQRR
jgi:16S rRNA (adenine1518-N6/adenine1519-N6)-dimethyltransferase